MTKIAIDTVAMTRQIRDAHYKQLKEKSIDKRIAFYRKKARELHNQSDPKHPVQVYLGEKSG